MKKFKAVTESGARYESNGHTIHYTGSSGPWNSSVIKPWVILSTPEVEGLKTPWSYLDYHRRMTGHEDWDAEKFKEVYKLDLDPSPSPYHETDVPIVGERFYVSGREEWRLSTVIVSLTDVEED